MAISFVSATVSAQVTNSQVVSVPAGVVDDDVMIALCAVPASAVLFSLPAGWTLIDQFQDTTGTDRTTLLCYRVASSEPASYTFTHDGASIRNSVVINAYRGVDTASVLDVVFNPTLHRVIASNANNPTNQPITTVNNGAWVALLSTITHDDITAAGAPAGYTLDSSIIFPDNASSDDCQQVWASKNVATAGTETPTAWTNSDNGTNVAESTNYTLALRAATGGPTIDNIDGDNSITDGQGTGSVTVSGFVGTPDTIQVTDGTNTTANLFVGGSDPTYTFSVLDIANQVGDSAAGQPDWFEGSLELIVSVGAESAQAPFTWQPAAGWATNTINGNTTDSGSISENRGSPYPDASSSYFPTSDSTSIDGAGLISTSKTTNFSVKAWASDTGTIEDVTVIVQSGGGFARHGSISLGIGIGITMISSFFAGGTIEGGEFTDEFTDEFT